MYERNAIVLERFFDDLFGNNERSNLKDNFIKYDNLVECSAKYTEATDSEDKIMQEYDDIAGRIKNIQKNQEILSQKSVKFHEERDIIFQNIAEEPQNIQKMFDTLNKNIDENNEKIKQNETDFVSVITSFMEKSDTRNALGRERKKVETDYSTALNQTLEAHKNINKEKLQNARNFSDNTAELEKELSEKIKKNGENEIVPFNNVAIKNAIKLDINIQKKIIDVLCNSYDKTSRLFLEIKNNNIRLERHRKLIKDSKIKLEFLDALKEYLIEFLDNERLTAVNGETEHKKRMKEACKNFEEDLVQINNLYELLLKEMTSKANKKMYRELYNVKYLEDLENSANEFEKEVSKLNLLGTVINPNHWRIDAIKKIYEVFYRNVTEIYGRDLSDFIIKQEESGKEEQQNANVDGVSSNNNETQGQDTILNTNEVEKSINQINNYVEEIGKLKAEAISKKTPEEDEFDEKIDMILGFDNKNSIINNKNIDEDKMNSKADTLSEYDSTIPDNEFWDEEEEEEGLYKWDDEEDLEKDDIDDWEDDFDDTEDDWEEDSEEDNNFENNIDYKYEENKEKVNLDDDNYNYDSYLEDEDNYEKNYIEDNPWDYEEDEDLGDNREIDSDKRDIITRFSESRNKKTKGKHNKRGEKSRGIFGKLIK